MLTKTMQRTAKIRYGLAALLVGLPMTRSLKPTVMPWVFSFVFRNRFCYASNPA